MNEKQIVNDYIDEQIHTWHACREINMTVYEFLGMTLSEYGDWVVDPSDYPDRIKNRIRLQQMLKMSCDCIDRSQCWEPCGELGKDEDYVEVVKTND